MHPKFPPLLLTTGPVGHDFIYNPGSSYNCTQVSLSPLVGKQVVKVLLVNIKVAGHRGCVGDDSDTWKSGELIVTESKRTSEQVVTSIPEAATNAPRIMMAFLIIICSWTKDLDERGVDRA